MARPQLNIELTQLIPVRDLLGQVSESLIQLMREFKKTGSDLVVENDLANVFGRAVIEPAFESLFKNEVLSSKTISPLHPDTKLSLEYGPGPTLDHAAHSKDKAYLSSVIQLSLLVAFHQQFDLASAIAQCMTQRHEARYPGSRAGPDQVGIQGTLAAICEQTTGFPWSDWSERVESRIYQNHVAYQALGLAWRAQLHCLPPPLLLASMDHLCTIQRFPGRYIMLVRGYGGSIVLVVWAHYLCGLNVRVTGLMSGDLMFGDASRIDIDIEWRITLSGDVTDNQVVVELLERADSEHQIIFKSEPCILTIENIAPDERHTVRGYGTRWLQIQLCTLLKPEQSQQLYTSIISYVTAMAMVACKKLFRGPLDESAPASVRPLDDLSWPLVDYRRIIPAAELLFEGLRLDKPAIDNNMCKGDHVDQLIDFPRPQCFLSGVVAEPDKRQTLFGKDLDVNELEIPSLTVLVILVACLADLEESAAAPLEFNLGELAAFPL